MFDICNETEKNLCSALFAGKAVKLALKQGAKADYFKLGEGSPIDAAVIGSSMAIIKFLVAHGAELTPHTLQAAEFVGREDVVKYLASLHKQ